MAQQVAEINREKAEALIAKGMKYVAFFRNVNLGQGKSPTRPQLEWAIKEGGAVFARSFLTNGTVIFTADSKPTAVAIVERAWTTLKSVCGLTEPAYVSSLVTLAEMVSAEPFAGYERADVHYCAASFMPDNAAARLAAPLWSPRRDLKVIQAAGNVALSVIYKVGGRPGDGTSFLQSILQVPVTTRNVTRTRKSTGSTRSCQKGDRH